MRIGLSRRRTAELLAGLMLAAFALHALVPVGFMPSGSGRFPVEICPEGFPAQLLHHASHHHGGGSPLHGEHCVFAGTGTSGPLQQHVLSALAPAARPLAPVRRTAAPPDIRLVHLPQARGPPPAT